jgi:hypothetical protein
MTAQIAKAVNRKKSRRALGPPFDFRLLGRCPTGVLRSLGEIGICA